MHFSLLNISSAISIGIIIGLMSAIGDARLKATVYSLPIPITIALIATHGKITGISVIGLALLCGFLWLVYFLYEKLHMNIIIADILAAILYIGIGYISVKQIKLSFTLLASIFIVFWAFIIYKLHGSIGSEKSKIKPRLSPYTKGAITTFLSLILFSLKDALSSIVVTFPFSGVFAVVETKNNLGLLARVFTRNSLAILGLFISIQVLKQSVSLFASLIVGWVVYFIVLKMVEKISV